MLGLVMEVRIIITFKTQTNLLPLALFISLVTCFTEFTLTLFTFITTSPYRSTSVFNGQNILLPTFLRPAIWAAECGTTSETRINTVLSSSSSYISWRHKSQVSNFKIYYTEIELGHHKANPSQSKRDCGMGIYPFCWTLQCRKIVVFLSYCKQWHKWVIFTWNILILQIQGYFLGAQPLLHTNALKSSL